MEFEANVLTINEPTLNGRVYPEDVIKKALEKYNKLVEEKRALGRIGYGQNSYLELDKAAFLVKEAKIENNFLKVKIETMSTLKNGLKAEQLIKEDKVTIRPMGIGSLDGDTIKDDYEIVYFALVNKEDAA